MLVMLLSAVVILLGQALWLCSYYLGDSKARSNNPINLFFAGASLCQLLSLMLLLTNKSAYEASLLWLSLNLLGCGFWVVARNRPKWVISPH